MDKLVSFPYSTTTGQSCGGYFTTWTGTLTSPNYPSDYYNNADCSYIIDLQHTGATSIGFHFNDFELETSYEFLHYGEGVHVNISRLGTFNGYNIPPDTVVTGSQMWFSFQSDYSVTDRV